MNSLKKYNDSFYEGQMNSSISSAGEIVPYIISLLAPKSVLDLGCGIGTWLKVFEENGVKEFIGVDGNFVSIKNILIPQDKFLRYDLAKRIKIGKKFDLAISLEVAEHLAESCADIFIESLTSHSDTIIFSAAIPFQGGTHHVNEQWQEYWVKKFEKKGYVFIDPFRKKFWNNKKVSFWYSQNMMLFVKKRFLKKNKMVYKKYLNTDRNFTSLVHPKKYLVESKNWNKVKKMLPLKIFKKIGLK